jgi:ABC-type oligopeptide transport system substrate-binding subunit
VLGCAVATCLALAACSSTSNTETGSDGTTGGASGGSGGSGGELIDGAQLSSSDNLTSFDPGLVQTLDESQITNALYDGLTDFDFTNKEDPELKGLVAEKWETNADATEFVFTIKKDLTFSNGDPVLPSSFKYAWVRNGQAEFASPYGYFIKYVKGGAELQDGTVTNLDQSIVADDEAMTLTVTLEAPEADFPAIVSHPFFAPLPEKVVSQLTDQTQWDKGLMIGNGPFKMESPKTDQEVVLVRNDSWAGSVTGTTSAKLDKLTFKISKDVESAYNSFESGEFDTASIPPGRYGDATATYPNTVESPTLGSYYFDFGSTDDQLWGEENLKLRQAISLAIDRDEINQKVYEGTREEATGVVMTGIPGYEADLCDYCKYDKDQAQKLFDEWKSAGNSLSEPITIDFNTGQGHEDVVAIIQNNLTAIGIESQLNPVSEKYFGTMADDGCHFCRAGWYADYPAYSTFMVDLYSTAALGGNNLGSFSDPKFDDLLEQAQSTVDDDARYALYRQAESYLLNDVVAVAPINFYVGDQVYQEKVSGYDQPPLGIIQWEDVSVSS